MSDITFLRNSPFIDTTAQETRLSETGEVSKVRRRTEGVLEQVKTALLDWTKRMRSAK